LYHVKSHKSSYMLTDLKGKVVLVTGASGGIGSEVYELFRSLGAKAYGTDVVAGAGADFFKGDLTDAAFRNHLVSEIIKKEGRIDVLVNNAGIYLRTRVLEITEPEWERLMNINVTSLFFLTQAVLDIMMKQKSGAIVSLASVAGKVGGIIAGAHYAASKAAIECLTKSIAKAAASSGVRSNAVAPGIIDTTMQDGVPAEQMDLLIKGIPMGRLGTAREVANVILMLSSDVTSYVTGQTISVNGGNHM
jgi:3-oxoacyl-[acyl-carrier protein] reductase